MAGLESDAEQCSLNREAQKNQIAIVQPANANCSANMSQPSRILKPDDFRATRVLVVGDAMLDRYLEGRTGRISPEAPVPVVKVETTFDRPGGAANVALNLASLGVPVTLLAFVGDDDDAAALEQRLTEAGVICRFVVARSVRTIVKLRVLSHQQQMLRLDFEDDFADESHEPLLELFNDLIGSHPIAVFSDYAKGTLKEVGRMIPAARARGLTVLVDPKGTDFTRYRGASVLTPNASEFDAVAGVTRDEGGFAARAIALREALALDHLLVTRGERGMSLFSSGKPVHVPAHALDVYDVTGAGDTAIATLAAGLGAGLPMEAAVRLANRAAGIVVGRKGTATVTFEELVEVAGLDATAPDESATRARIRAAKRRGETIVMTNGCFDVLHAGHLDYLTRARVLGDRLVVAVNSDASARRLKGPSRPVNALEHRLAMLRALRCVDFVVSFDGSIRGGVHEDTPLDIITELAPDILVKGGDYGIDRIVGAKEVLAAGGQVRVLPFVEGLSTSSILGKLAGEVA